MSFRTDRLAAQAEIRRKYGYVPEKELYLKEAAQRRQWPQYVRDKIEKCVQYILQRYPHIKGVQLVGSYAAGTYIDENTADDFKELRRKAGVQVKLSDFDFETEPLILSAWVTPEGYKIHLCKPFKGHRINLEDLLSL